MVVSSPLSSSRPAVKNGLETTIETMHIEDTLKKVDGVGMIGSKVCVRWMGWV